MNSFMGSCNLYRNWQSILTLFAVLSFAWTIPISRHRQCHCSLTIVFSVFNVHPTKRIPPFALETKKTRFDPANLFSCDRRGTKTRSLFYRLVSCYFVNLFSSLEDHSCAIAPNGNTNLRLFRIITKWFFWFHWENMCFRNEFVILKKGGHTSNSQQIWILPSKFDIEYFFWFYVHFPSIPMDKNTLGSIKQPRKV